MVHIVTDSDANLPLDLIKQFDITVVPIQIHIDGQTYMEDQDINSDQFIEMLPRCRELPTTSQPSPGQFIEAFAPWVERGETILSVHVSGELSGTIRSAQAAAETWPDAPIHFLDTRSISVGEGMIALRAARMAAAGHDVADIITALQPMIEHNHLFFLVDTLEYLHKGGRIGGAARFIGTLLDMKPILTVQNGKIEALERQRTRKKALAHLEELVVEHAGNGQAVYLGVTEIAARQEAQTLAEHLRARLNPVEFLMCQVGPGLSTHSGPGSLGVCVYAGPESQ